MSPYLCYVYPSERSTPHFEVAAAEDDDSARAYALELLRQRPQHQRVEIWQDHRRVARFTPADAGRA